MPVAAVTGLAAEARIAREVGLRALAGGGDAARTAAAISRLIGEGATGLVSFGICGGLDPRLASGTMVLPRATRSEGGARRCVNEAWHAR
jgi:adenosylhomocysteine nucleosidase